MKMGVLRIGFLISYNIAMVGILVIIIFYFESRANTMQEEISCLMNTHAANLVILEDLEAEVVRLQELIKIRNKNSVYLNSALYILLVKIGFSCFCAVLILVWCFYLKYYFVAHFNDPLMVAAIKEAKAICTDIVLRPDLFTGFDAFGTLIECECINKQLFLYITLAGTNIRHYVGDISFVLRHYRGPDLGDGFLGGAGGEAVAFVTETIPKIIF